MKKHILIILCLISIFRSNVSAEHIFGADLTYECIGQDSFIINLTVYRDCNGINISNDYVVIQSTTGTTIDTVSMTLPSPIDITPICASGCSRCQSSSCAFPYGVEQYNYTQLYVFPANISNCNIVFTYFFLPRMSTIGTGAGNKNFYTETTLNRCISPQNSSPKFTNSPIVICCIGQDLTMNYGAIDIDKDSIGGLSDSLAYKWIYPQSGKGANISYSNPYDYNKPIYFWGFPNTKLPFPRGFHLDKYTGDISFRPMKIEQTVMVLEVEEFRNGVSIGKVRRDIQLIVINCPNNKAPILSGPFYKEICEGDTVSFNITTNDYDPNDTLTISWNEAIPGAYWSDNNDSVKHPTGQLTWVPPFGSAGNQYYNFTVNVKDDACPLVGQSTQVYQIYVKPYPIATIQENYTGCGHYNLIANPIKGKNILYTWNTNFYPNHSASGDTLSYIFTSSGIYNYSISLNEQSCITTYHGTLILDPVPHAIMPSSINICFGNTVDISPQIMDTTGFETFYWSHGDTGITSISTSPLYHDTLFTFYIVDSTGCIGTFHTQVIVHQPPEIIVNEDGICFNKDISISPNLNFDRGNLKNIVWTDLATNLIFDTLANHKFYQTTNFEIAVEDEFGCESKDTFNIYKNELELILGNSVTTCEYDTLKIIPIVKNNIGKTNYLWSNLSNSYNLSSIINHDQWLSLEVSDSVGCKTHDSVWVDVKNVDVNMKQKYDFCAGDSISIAAIYTLEQTNSNVSIEWFESSLTNKISSGSNLITTNQGTYILKVTDTMNCWDTTSFRTITLPLPIIEIYSQIPKTTICPEYGRIQMFASISGGTFGGQWLGNVDNLGIFDANKPEGNYDIYYYFKGNNGCDNTDTFSFTIKKARVDINSPDTEVCKGHNLNLQAGYQMADQMQWFKSPTSFGNFIGNVNDTQIIYQHDTNEANNRGFWIYAKTIDQVCPEAVDSEFIYVAAVPKADFAYIGPTSEGDYYIISGSSIDYDFIKDYYWDFGNGLDKGPSMLIKKLYPGTYDVSHKVVSNKGCSDSITKYNYITVENSLEEVLNDFGLKIYPNPSTNNVIIESEKEIEQIQIYNSLSQLVWEKEKPSKIQSIDVSNYQSGIYLILFKQNKQTYTAKIMIK